jgi:hypothetical protein
LRRSGIDLESSDEFRDGQRQLAGSGLARGKAGRVHDRRELEGANRLSRWRCQRRYPDFQVLTLAANLHNIRKSPVVGTTIDELQIHHFTNGGFVNIHTGIDG